ncbi:MAG: IS630 family transposase [Victivallaceae bacterium]|nr:IS630 family transposase [Victivallaceae bacterium]
MPRTAPIIKLEEDVRLKLMQTASSKTEEARRVLRAKVILGCADGLKGSELAGKFNIMPNTVTEYRKRFIAEGLKSLDDKPRSGRPPIYGREIGEKILAKLDEKPPSGMSRWDGGSLASALGISDDYIWRFLKKNSICLSRQRSWCISTDPEFATKAADIVGLYLAPPCNAIVISVDEKPSMQALSRKTGYVYAENGKIVRAYKSTYKRNGTLNLFGALEIATGMVRGKITERKKRSDFLQFMDELLAGYSDTNTTEFHVILDNYCIHKKNTAWLDEHKNVYFHFTPTSASWLNQIEIWFGIMSRKVLRGASHNSKAELKEAIEKFIEEYSKNPHPFKWRKREVKGSQIKDTISNLCN